MTSNSTLNGMLDRTIDFVEKHDRVLSDTIALSGLAGIAVAAETASKYLERRPSTMPREIGRAGCKLTAAASAYVAALYFKEQLWD